MARLGCIAADAAAAMEFGALLATGGVRTVLGTGSAPGALPEAEAVLVTLPRGTTTPVADALLACEALLAAGAGQIAWVTDAGFTHEATGAVADALLRRLQAGFAAVAPAFPSRGRSVYLGHLFIGPSLASGEPNLPRRLAMQADAPVGLIPFPIVAEGAGAIRREMARLAEAGRRYAVADGVADAHLQAMAEATASQALVIGGAGLAPGLAKALGGGAQAEAWPAPGGACAVLAASEARVALAQLGYARLHVPVLEVESTSDVAPVLDRAAPLLSADEPVVVTVSAAPARDAGLLAALAEGLLSRGVGRLLLSGEAAFGAGLDQLGGGGLRIGAEIEPGVCWCRAEATGLHLGFKPGTAGGRDILLRAFLTAP
jgi:uncharacterized protein YgbK (DUF1537 family)